MYVTSEILIAVTTKRTIFWDVMPCSMVGECTAVIFNIEELVYLLLAFTAYSSILNMEVVHSPEISVNIHQTTSSCIPEDSILRTVYQMV
jgi:hypothetical protein